MEKKCTKCGIVKAVSEFSLQKIGRYGVRARCKKCVKAYNKEYRKNHEKETIAYTKEYRKIHKKERSIYDKIYKESHKKEMAIYSKEYKKNHKRKIAIHNKKYRDNHKKELAVYIKKYQNKRHATDPRYRLNKNMTSAIYKALFYNKDGQSWEKLVGYTINALRIHLEKQFTKGMTWENYGSWHLEHKTPKSVFNFTKPEHEDFKKCWALKNLQPMWASENMSKGAKLTKHFQPSLLL